MGGRDGGSCDWIPGWVEKGVTPQERSSPGGYGSQRSELGMKMRKIEV